jgi:hypothetical protein
MHDRQNVRYVSGSPQVLLDANWITPLRMLVFSRFLITLSGIHLWFTRLHAKVRGSKKAYVLVGTDRNWVIYKPIWNDWGVIVLPPRSDVP